jgi:hypothetical protein
MIDNIMFLNIIHTPAFPKSQIYPYWHQAGFAERNPFPTAD